MLLLLICLSVYLPGLIALPPVDRDESRFAQASRQMAESGDVVVPRIQDRPRINKPPLIYWLQAASAVSLGDRPGQYPNFNIWVFRLPSVLCAIGSVLLTWRMGLRLFDPRAALLGAVLLAVCPMVVWDAHQARADQVLLFTTTATMYALMGVWLRRPVVQSTGQDAAGTREAGRRPGSWVTPVLFWIALALGILAKGPITPLVAGLTAFSLSLCSRSHRWLLSLRPLCGVLIVTAIVAPWVVLVCQRIGWSNYLHSVLGETVGRSTSPKENHWYPPGFHTVLFCILFWPGSLLTGLGLARAFGRAFPVHPVPQPEIGRIGRIRNRLTNAAGDRRSRFLLCWIIPSWLFFELISTKLPHYTMPLYPALALISARAVFAAQAGCLAGLRRFGTRVGFALWCIIGVAAVFGLSLAVITIGRPDPAELWMTTLRGLGLPAIVAAGGLVAASRALWLGQFLRAQLLGAAVAVLWGATLLQFILPGARRLWVTPQIMSVMGSGSRPAAVGYHEDSLIFSTRGRARRLTNDQFARAEFGDADWIVFPEGEPVTPAAAARLAPDRTLIDGLNYSNGRAVRLAVTHVLPAPPRSP